MLRKIFIFLFIYLFIGVLCLLFNYLYPLPDTCPGCITPPSSQQLMHNPLGIVFLWPLFIIWYVETFNYFRVLFNSSNLDLYDAF